MTVFLFFKVLVINNYSTKIGTMHYIVVCIVTSGNIEGWMVKVPEIKFSAPESPVSITVICSVSTDEPGL